MVSPQTPPPVASPSEPPSNAPIVSGGGPYVLYGAGDFSFFRPSVR